MSTTSVEALAQQLSQTPYRDLIAQALGCTVVDGVADLRLTALRAIEDAQKLDPTAVRQALLRLGSEDMGKTSAEDPTLTAAGITYRTYFRQALTIRTQ